MITLVHRDKRIYSVVLKTKQPNTESALKDTFEKMEKEFGNISLGIDVRSKKLVPFELVLDITMTVASGVAVGVVIRLLERLWEEFRRKEMVPQTQGMDGIQSSAERYLRDIGVTKFKTLERKDKGPYVTFVFKDQ